MSVDEIKKLRESLGLTLTELAYKVGVSGDAVRKWEGGLAKPSGSATILLRQLAESVPRNGHAKRQLVGAK